MIRPEHGRRYWNPYLAGLAVGTMVTVAFAAGHYFGASRVFATLARVLRGDAVSMDHWMTWELVGVAAGGFLGAMLAGRFRPAGLRASRVVTAVLGGALVMIGSRFAAGCTSGLALSGGIRMSAGAFVFMGAMFAGGFAAAALFRRIWS